MISGCVAILSGPGALWRIPGLEVPQIEAEMRAAWNIKTKFVDRWSHRHEPAAEQGASCRSPAQSDGGWPNRCTAARWLRIAETRRSCRARGFRNPERHCKW
jgi:hypothetical protein